MNALAHPEVGKYLNEHFCSSFQKVATFRIVNGAKQGGNVAAYFCAPDGRVLHCVAGPVDAETLLREARWVVATTKKAIAEAKGDGAKFKAFFRRAHAEKLRQDFGLVVEPVTVDIEPQDPNSALTYQDPSGRPLAPKLPPPPINGPDVRFGADKQAEAANAPNARALQDRAGRRVWVNNIGVVHQLMAAHALVKIERVYGTIFENVLGERISTAPVQIVKPFSWVQEGKQPRQGRPIER